MGRPTRITDNPRSLSPYGILERAQMRVETSIAGKPEAIVLFEKYASYVLRNAYAHMLGSERKYGLRGRQRYSAILQSEPDVY